MVASESVHVDEVRGVLKFSPLRKSDEAFYTCKASNDVGADQARGFVKVLGTQLQIIMMIILLYIYLPVPLLVQ